MLGIYLNSKSNLIWLFRPMQNLQIWLNFNLECLSRFRLCQYIHTLSWQEQCCQALPSGLVDRWRFDELSDLCDFHAVMPAPYPCCMTPALPASPKALWSYPLCQARRALRVVWGYHTTYFGAACQPACSTGICKHYRSHPLRWLLANLGCGQHM